MKTETLQDSLESYQAKLREKKRNSRGVRAGVKSIATSREISYYVTGKGSKIKINETASSPEWDPFRMRTGITNEVGRA
jgi:hypothetical protein